MCLLGEVSAAADWTVLAVRCDNLRSHSLTTRRSNDELNIGLILDAARHRLGIGSPRLGL
jgi:hypothetical protein